MKIVYFEQDSPAGMHCGVAKGRLGLILEFFFASSFLRRCIIKSRIASNALLLPILLLLPPECLDTGIALDLAN